MPNSIFSTPARSKLKEGIELFLKGESAQSDPFVEMGCQLMRETLGKIEKLHPESSSSLNAFIPKLAELFSKALENELDLCFAEELIQVDEDESIIQIDTGFLSPYFRTDTVNSQALLTNTHVLIVTEIIDRAELLVALLQECIEKGASLLIGAPDITNDALSTLILSKINGTLKVAAFKAEIFDLEKVAKFSACKKSTIKECSLADLGFLKKALLKETTITLTNSELKHMDRAFLKDAISIATKTAQELFFLEELIVN